jgi:hypothetical protein
MHTFHIIFSLRLCLNGFKLSVAYMYAQSAPLISMHRHRSMSKGGEQVPRGNRVHPGKSLPHFPEI